MCSTSGRAWIGAVHDAALLVERQHGAHVRIGVGAVRALDDVRRPIRIVHYLAGECLGVFAARRGGRGTKGQLHRLTRVQRGRRRGALGGGGDGGGHR